MRHKQLKNKQTKKNKLLIKLVLQNHQQNYKTIFVKNYVFSEAKSEKQLLQSVLESAETISPHRI